VDTKDNLVYLYIVIDFCA